ncbi:transposase [Salinispira pacifica]|uniref:transposase n=1 Tax=Salinispira pacifica TaxID=1307761 RepID=UPI003CC77F14
MHRQFSRSTEQSPQEQTVLFAEAERYSVQEQAPDTDVGEIVTVREHKKAKPGRKPIDPKVPRIDFEHDIDEPDKQCACGCTMERIGEEVTERLQTIPEQIFAERHIRPKYACKNCEGSGDEDRPAVRIAPTPPSIIPGSIVTPGLLAFILVNKFADHLPYYPPGTAICPHWVAYFPTRQE